jgi:hypothetical protein
MRGLFSLFKKHQYALAIFFVLLIEFAVKIPIPDLSNGDMSFHYFHYLLSYKLGFVGRSLAGTIVQFLAGNFLSVKFVYIFISVSIVFIAGLISILLAAFIKNADEKYKLFAIGAVIFYLASPVSVSYLFYIGNFGRPDLYINICLFLIVLLLGLTHSGTGERSKRIKELWLLFLIPILCFAIVAFHVYGLDFYIPLVLLFLLYKFYIDRKKSSLILLIISFFVSVIFGIYFLSIGSETKILEQVVEKYYMTKNPDTDIVLMLEVAPPNNFATFPPASTIPSYSKILANFFLTVILLSPLITLFICFWRFVIKKESDKYKKIIFLLSALPVYTIPVFILQPDWGRYCSFVLIAQFTFIFYFFYCKEESFLYAADKIESFFRKNIFLFLIFIVYMLIIGRFPHWIKFPIIENIKTVILYLIRG